MSKKEGFFRGVLDSLQDGVYFVDMNRRITYWNKGAERITGYESSEAVGISCSDNLLVHIDDKGVNLCEAGCPLAQTLMDGLERETEAYLQHKDGHRLPVIIRVSPLRDSSGRIVGAVESFSDNSSKAALLQRIDQLQKESLVDPLTGLANRSCIDMTLHSRINEMQRYGWPCGVLFLDIDNFKIVNDTYGHNVGDGVLMMVARTLSSNLRAHDLLGRYGGEEFVAIITHVDMAQLHTFADRLRLLVEKSRHDTEYSTIRVTVSIGATVVRPEDTVETAITRADLFMYNSKISGRNRVSLETMLEQNGQDLIRKGWSASGPVNERIAASRIQFQSLGRIEPARLPKK
ncbi:MAG: sensor domain-containing diguanylate cyclase, partial [Deltaproteobacteria bacterium]|nr:sensor domain-containing diguanylate cyclase [Deltaproteobacteria bacterium]